MMQNHLGDRCRKPVTLRRFDAVRIPNSEPVRRAHFDALFDDCISGIYLADAVSSQALEDYNLCWNVGKETLKKNKRYSGVASNLAAVGGPSHWNPRYPGNNNPTKWQQYFDQAKAWEYARAELFEFSGDPFLLLIGLLQSAYGGQNVSRLQHSRYGQTMSSCVIREGVPSRHIDCAAWDVLQENTGHIGAVLVLESSPDTCQRLYQHKLAAPIEHGIHQGNYDLSVPEDAMYVDIPSPAGSINFVSPENVHEVVSESTHRRTVACHIIRTNDGKIKYYA